MMVILPRGIMGNFIAYFINCPIIASTTTDGKGLEHLL